MELIKLNIESLAFEGFGVARHNGIVHFVKGGLPGEKVLARILKKKKNYVEGVVEEIVQVSPNRIKPECKHFGVCGGCSWQDLSYEQQLFWKKRHVEDSFERIGKISVPIIYDTMPAPKIFGYRNKMEFSFGNSRWLTDIEINSGEELINKHFALGLHVPERFDKVLDIEDCRIHPFFHNEILNSIRQKSLEMDLKPYNLKNHLGFLRNLIIRTSEYNRELMVILITTEPKEENEFIFTDWYRHEFKDKFPQMTNLILAVNNSFSPVSVGECEYIKGSQYLTEKILNIDFRISPFSFFQTNSSQLDNFISKILEFADLNSKDTIWDLYCGTGSISLPAAKKIKKVFGIELIESSINDAKSNAELNGIKNAEFICMDLHGKSISELLNTIPKPDKIILDPPRAGMHKNLVEALLAADCKTIVYVSCNPATQARDCNLLSIKYDVIKIQPVDMFPHTYHVESLALLERRWKT